MSGLPRLASQLVVLVHPRPLQLLSSSWVGWWVSVRVPCHSHRPHCRCGTLWWAGVSERYWGSECQPWVCAATRMSWVRLQGGKEGIRPLPSLAMCQRPRPGKPAKRRVKSQVRLGLNPSRACLQALQVCLSQDWILWGSYRGESVRHVRGDSYGRFRGFPPLRWCGACLYG